MKGESLYSGVTAPEAAEYLGQKMMSEYLSKRHPVAAKKHVEKPEIACEAEVLQ